MDVIVPNDQKLSHAAGDFRQPEIRSVNGQAQSALAPALC